MKIKIEWVHWEDLPTGLLKSFSKAFIENKSTELISNVETEYKVLKIDEGKYFPVTINNTELDSSFVCSPYTAYALYSKEELTQKINNKLIQFPLLLVIKLLGKWLQYGQINKNIHINNFLLSTNPYPEWDGIEIKEITEFITKEYPNHSIIFRSLNRFQHQHLLDVFKKNKYRLIGSRQVYIYNLNEQNWLKHKNNKNDLKLIKKQNLTFIEHDDMEPYLEEALQLYQMLYLEKYSKYNPQFTIKYFTTCYNDGIVHFQGYKNSENVLKSFSGLFIIGNTITSPLIGYDTAAPQKEGLYIHAAQLALLCKFKTNLLLNLSSGAPEFKRMRGGEPSIEYSAVYSRHLNRKRKITFIILQFISNKIGVPLMKKYEM